MPPNTVKVDRSTRWGNPFRPGDPARHPITGGPVTIDSVATAVSLFALYLQSPAGAPLAAAARRELRGKHLACWCKEGSPCHGDLLLTLANAATTGLAPRPSF